MVEAMTPDPPCDPPRPTLSAAIPLLLGLGSGLLVANPAVAAPQTAGPEEGERPRLERDLPSSPGDSSILILSAASLTDVLPRVAEAWETTGGMPVRFSFDATSRLAPQILQGAPADLFFSADERWMDWVEERGGILQESRLTLLANRMVLVVPEGSPLNRSGPGGLEIPSVRRIALAGENVPAGRYGQAALESAGVWEAIRDRVARAGTVRGALEWVARGEADAGVVYRTDALAEPRVRVIHVFPEGSHPPVSYPAAVLREASRPGAASAFLAFCQSREARAIFRAQGFEAPTATPEGVTGETPSLPDPWSAIRLSFLVALAATLAGFVPAVALGWMLARWQFPGKNVLATLALVPLVLPPVVTGFLLLSLLGSRSPLGQALAAAGLPIPFTLLGATLAALVVGLPLYVVSIRNAFQVVDPRYEEVSWTLGRRPWPTFLRVSFPLALPGIAAGAVLAFARALGEFGATVVLAGNMEGQTRTIALAVYTLLESPSGREAIWVLVGASVLLSMMALLGYETLSRRQRRRMEVRGVR